MISNAITSTQISRLFQDKQLVISVDTQKKEWVGNIKNAVRTGRPDLVNVNDFADKNLG